MTAVYVACGAAFVAACISAWRQGKAADAELHRRRSGHR